MPPKMIVVAGPPGSGKSSVFPVSAFGVAYFNADDRAAELKGGSYIGISNEIRRIANREFERFCLVALRSGTSATASPPRSPGSHASTMAGTVRTPTSVPGMHARRVVLMARKKDRRLWGLLLINGPAACHESARFNPGPGRGERGQSPDIRKPPPLRRAVCPLRESLKSRTPPACQARPQVEARRGSEAPARPRGA